MKLTSADIGKRIRKKRELRGLTREKLSGFVDISPHFLSEVERGLKGTSAETLFKLCEGLKVSADYFLFGREDTNDISELLETLRYIDPKYLPLIDEFIKLFLNTINLFEAGPSKNEPEAADIEELDKVAESEVKYIEDKE